MSDLISRQAAIKEAYKIVIDGDTYEVVQAETLMGLPSADAQQVRHGHWILDIDNDYPVMMRTGWRCSNCGRRETYGTTPYCPYCGSKMEVKK